MPRPSPREPFARFADTLLAGISDDTATPAETGPSSRSAFTRATNAVRAFLQVPKRLIYASPPTLDGGRLISEKLGLRP
jgi:hypothetical protein